MTPETVRSPATSDDIVHTLYHGWIPRESPELPQVLRVMAGWKTWSQHGLEWNNKTTRCDFVVKTKCPPKTDSGYSVFDTCGTESEQFLRQFLTLGDHHTHICSRRFWLDLLTRFLLGLSNCGNDEMQTYGDLVQAGVSSRCPVFG